MTGMHTVMLRHSFLRPLHNPICAYVRLMVFAGCRVASHVVCHPFQLPQTCCVNRLLTCHAPLCAPAHVALCCRSPERREDVTYAGNYLVFGHGPHYCVGKEYANNHLIAFLAILSTSLDWTRFRCVQDVWCIDEVLRVLSCVAQTVCYCVSVPLAT